MPEGDVESRPMGSGGVDIMMAAYVRKLFPFSLECKNWKKTPGNPEIEQAIYNAYPNTRGCVVWKPPRVGFEKSVIMFRFDDFIELWKLIQEGK